MAGAARAALLSNGAAMSSALIPYGCRWVSDSLRVDRNTAETGRVADAIALDARRRLARRAGM